MQEIGELLRHREVAEGHQLLADVSRGRGRDTDPVATRCVIPQAAQFA